MRMTVDAHNLNRTAIRTKVVNGQHHTCHDPVVLVPLFFTIHVLQSATTLSFPCPAPSPRMITSHGCRRRNIANQFCRLNSLYCPSCSPTLFYHLHCLLVQASTLRTPAHIVCNSIKTRALSSNPTALFLRLRSDDF